MRMQRAALVVAALASAGACTSFEGSAPPADAGLEDDGGVASDASPDGAPDGASLGPSCSSDELIVGSRTVTGQANVVPDDYADAYAFAVGVPPSPFATCARIWIEGLTMRAASVKIGVYSDAAAKPKDLLTTGVISGPSVKQWNATPLNPPLRVEPGARLWLAVTVSDGQVTLDVRPACTPGAGSISLHAMQGVNGNLPNPFATTRADDPACEPALYLSP